MNGFYTKFPSLPLYRGIWAAVQVEPIIGSGEKITIAVCAKGEDGTFKVIESLPNQILDLLFRSQKQNMSDLIYLVKCSLERHLSLNKELASWRSPFTGVVLSKINDGLDVDIEGIIAQGLRFSSSFSNLLSDFGEYNQSNNIRKKNSHNFTNKIFKQVININPSLKDSFNRRIRVSDSDAKTSFGFLNERYVSNFGILAPSNLSSSLTNIKARIFDIEALKKSTMLFKPTLFEVIVGSPSFDDPTLSDKTLYRLKNSFEMIQEIADKDEICVFRVNGVKDAAERVLKQAA
ncbi:hypothetical protein [Photobacterium leiognathi]|uniref:hypothetical protein n=1 Tax=Photobacterium leiognathi TaxID=553611 RepID=UPI003DA0E66A